MSEAHDDHPHIDGVVVGTWNDAGELLVIRRSEYVRLAPLKVCFPGGAIEHGESPEHAACREMREELAVDVRLGPCVWEWDHPERPLHLYGFVATLPTDAVITPEPGEVREFMWLKPADIASHPDGLVSNRHFVDALVAHAPRFGSARE